MADKENLDRNEEEKKCQCGCKKSFRPLRLFMYIAAGVLLLIVICLLFIGSVVKTGIQTVGSMVTDCKVTVDSVNVSILRGKLEMKNLIVGNPDGYNTESAFKVSRIHVSMQPLSIFSGGKLVIDEISINAPEITYEIDPFSRTSNISVLQKNVQNFIPAGNGDDAEKDSREIGETEKKGRPVEISKVAVTEGQINFSATIAGGKSLPIVLPPIELKDIGRDKEITSYEATASILNEICRNIGSVASNGSQFMEEAGKAAKEAGKAAKEAAKAAGKAAKALGESVKDFFKGEK